MPDHMKFPCAKSCYACNSERQNTTFIHTQNESARDRNHHETAVNVADRNGADGI